MKMIFRYMGKYKGWILTAMLLKLSATFMELLLPYLLEHNIDNVVPTGNLKAVLFWSCMMFVAALGTWAFNVMANRTAIKNAHNVSYDVRKDLFEKVMQLSGDDFDTYGLPSLISRMTSDSYNVQSAVQSMQAMCVRAPMMLVGGLTMTLFMDWKLSLILITMVPLILITVIFVSRKGIPMYKKVQQNLDNVVRIMRENITGIRVVKALSKEEYEKRRYAKANNDLAKSDIKASTIMAIPSPTMQLCLNIGLVGVVIVGASRVNQGTLKPGVILAFLTYFNMITMGVMGINRIFLLLSKASASALRIDEIIQTPVSLTKIETNETTTCDEYIRFKDVDFYYNATRKIDGREKALDHIDFSLKKGESLGIIGPTGCGKTTIINLLMRFYDATSGQIFVDGKDVRTYDKDELHKKFGTCFQNDMIFQDTLRENISFGRNLEEETILNAIEDAIAKEYVDTLDGGIDFKADIKGANLSGGQKQRLLVSRALANNPEILILDDSSSALDYKTDSLMRHAIQNHHNDSTLILIAQRVSSVMNMDHIIVMDNGKIIGYGTHQTLLETCDAYKDIYKTQMGAME